MVATVEATRAQVERILQSKVFRTSEVLRNLLAYLAEKSLAGTADSLKEYTIGLDALGKPSSFDPRQESVVRMHAARLRQKLGEYYRTEGIEDPIIIDLPKGGFKVSFEPRQAFQTVTTATPAEVEVPVRRWRRREMLLAVFLVLALASAVYFGLRLWKVETGTQDAWTPELRQLWDPLLAPNQPLLVCISTPLFVKIPGFGFVRDSAVNDWGEVSESSHISAVEEAVHSGMAQPSYGYTGVGTASGAFMLGQFLSPRKQRVVLTRANLLSWPELTENNVVFLGPTTGIHQTEDIPMSLELVLESNGIRNLKPRPGEPAYIPDQPSPEGEESGVSHALVSRVPGMNGRGSILMLSGNQTAGVMGGVQAFTNPALARMLVSKIKTGSGDVPKYFQVVLNVKSMDNVPVDVSYMFHRDLSDSKPPAATRP
jgi:hypothetical protein